MLKSLPQAVLERAVFSAENRLYGSFVYRPQMAELCRID